MQGKLGWLVKRGPFDPDDDDIYEWEFVEHLSRWENLVEKKRIVYFEVEYE